MSVTIKRKKNTKLLNTLSKTYNLKVGIFSDAGSYDGGIDVTKVAWIQQDGYKKKKPKIPETKFMIKAFNSDKFKSKIAKMNIEVHKQKISPKKVLDIIGGELVNDVKTYIEDIKTPNNASSTIKAKGFDNRLIHTRKMKKSVGYKINNGSTMAKG
jgi:hypothetical protein